MGELGQVSKSQAAGMGLSKIGETIGKEAAKPAEQIGQVASDVSKEIKPETSMAKAAESGVTAPPPPVSSTLPGEPPPGGAGGNAIIPPPPELPGKPLANGASGAGGTGLAGGTGIIPPPPEAPVKSIEDVISASGTKPPSKPPVDISINPDEYINDFGKYVTGKQSSMDWEATQKIRTSERGEKAANYLQQIQDGLTKGLPPDQILANAESTLRGKLSSVDTGIYLPPDKRQPFYSKLINSIMKDGTIPESKKAWTIQSTKQAMDNFLDGNLIPEIPGITGQSAKTRLLNIFKDNPEIKEILGIESVVAANH